MHDDDVIIVSRCCFQSFTFKLIPLIHYQGRMRGLVAYSSIVVMRESLILQELSLLSISRGFVVSAASTSSKSGDSKKGRTQELLDALTPTEKVTASETELEEASKRHVLCGLMER